MNSKLIWIKAMIAKYNPCDVDPGKPLPVITQFLMKLTTDCPCCTLLRGVLIGLIIGGIFL